MINSLATDKQYETGSHDFICEKGARESVLQSCVAHPRLNQPEVACFRYVVVYAKAACTKIKLIATVTRPYGRWRRAPLVGFPGAPAGEPAGSICKAGDEGSRVGEGDIVGLGAVGGGVGLAVAIITFDLGTEFSAQLEACR
jgi:hypothetical protein